MLQESPLSSVGNRRTGSVSSAKPRNPRFPSIPGSYVLFFWLISTSQQTLSAPFSHHPLSAVTGHCSQYHYSNAHCQTVNKQWQNTVPVTHVCQTPRPSMFETFLSLRGDCKSHQYCHCWHQRHLRAKRLLSRTTCRGDSQEKSSGVCVLGRKGKVSF